MRNNSGKIWGKIGKFQRKRGQNAHVSGIIDQKGHLPRFFEAKPQKSGNFLNFPGVNPERSLTDSPEDRMTDTDGIEPGSRSDLGLRSGLAANQSHEGSHVMSGVHERF
jgi:hypothetical protein